MRLLTDKLPEQTRSAVRFVIVGLAGTALQYALYYAFLKLFAFCWGESDLLTSIAFGLGFCLEMIVNYIVTSYYTFGSEPNWKNAIGFFGARVPNYLIQNGLLLALIWCGLSEEVSGIWAILVAGVVNYFLLNVIYKHLKK